MISVTSATLFTKDDLEGHRVRLLAAEKGEPVLVQVSDELPEELSRINPTGAHPVLLDKGLILHGAQILDAYFDERYPAPSLLPTSPIARAKVRFLADRIRDWYPLAEQASTLETIAELHVNIRDFEENLDPHQPFFVGSLFSMVDIAIAPVLNILPQIGYQPSPRGALYHYIERLQARRSWFAARPPEAVRSTLDPSLTGTFRILH